MGALAIDIATSHAPVVDEGKCTSCGLCLAVCPGQGYPVSEWSATRCDKNAKIHQEKGPVRTYLFGYSTDRNIRLNAASGGIATSLMLHLLETREVDEVAVVGMENERPRAILTHDPKVVRDAMMSKYGPVPILATLIPELRKRPRRIAMTTTPCQLAGWMRAAERIPRLQESTVLTLGVFCGQIQGYDALTSIAATLGIRYPGEAKFVAWRYGPYPGSARFERPDGTAAEKPLYPWLDVAVPHFSLHRCLLCPDGGNWLADMTLGDVHRGGTDKTVIVCRTKQAEEALESASRAGRIVIQEMAPAEVENCVIRHITRSKLLPAITRNSWLKKRGQIVPEFDYDMPILLAGRVRAMVPFWIWQYRLILWVRHGWRRRLLLKHPSLMEKTGHFLYQFPATIPGFGLGVGTIKVFARILARITGGWRTPSNKCLISERSHVVTTRANEKGPLTDLPDTRDPDTQRGIW